MSNETRSKALHALVGESVELTNRLLASGFDAVTIADTLEAEGITGKVEDKLRSCACVLINILARAKAVEEEARRLSEETAKAMKAAEHLRTYMLNCMVAVDMVEIPATEPPFVRIKVTESSGAVVIDDFEKFSLKYGMRFMRTVPEKVTPASEEPDKTEIGKAIRGGEEVEFARLLKTKKLELK